MENKEKRKGTKKSRNQEPIVEADDDGLNASEASTTADEDIFEPKVTVKVEKVENNDDDKDETSTTDWPENDLIELFGRMAAAIPEKDTLAYSTRVEKLNWEAVAFKEYTGEECKATWLRFQKKMRKFRLLNELLTDAREWLRKPWASFYAGRKTKRHPYMPRKPLSTYMLFYLQKKDEIMAENPGLKITGASKLIAEMYKNLSPAARKEYTKRAAERRKIYEMELVEFQRLHPKDDRALDEEPKYQEAFKTYVSQNPDFSEAPAREGKFLTRPAKAPSSPYALFSRVMLRSVEIKEVHPRYRMAYVSDKWKALTDEEKKEYRVQFVHMREQYKLDLAAYLDPSAEDKRREALEGREHLKRGRGVSKEEDDSCTCRKKNNKEKSPKKNAKGRKRKSEETDSAESDDGGECGLIGAFAKPTYWNRMKKEEKQTFTSAMMKLKERLDSRFEAHINARGSDSSEDSDGSSECSSCSS